MSRTHDNSGLGRRGLVAQTPALVILCDGARSVRRGCLVCHPYNRRALTGCCSCHNRERH